MSVGKLIEATKIMARGMVYLAMIKGPSRFVEKGSIVWLGPRVEVASVILSTR
jgi:hypothetical protein